MAGLLGQEQTQYKHGHMSWHHEQSNKIKRKRVNDDEEDADLRKGLSQYITCSYMGLMIFLCH